MKKKEVSGIWKYLHHIISGFIILIEGIVLFYFRKSFFFSILFVIIGSILFIDDLLAETKDISIFNKVYSNLKKLKIIGLIFFIAMQILFVILVL